VIYAKGVEEREERDGIIKLKIKIKIKIK